MNGVGAGAACRIDDAIDPQVTVGRRVASDRHRLVCHPHVTRGAIALGIDGDRRDAHLAARADDPDRDLAAVRDQNLAQNL